jgi:surfeit locus 1 family protein
MTLLGLSLLIGLGVWQLKRKAWKEELIATLSDRLAAPPSALPAPTRWADLSASKDEFRRVTFPAEFLHEKEGLVYSTGSALRSDANRPGYWVFTPARLPGGSIVMVNRGFVPEDRRSPATRQEGQVSGLIDIVGVMRWPERPGAFTPDADPAKNLWFLRDHLSIAATKQLGGVAPFYVEQEAPPAPGGLPSVAPLQVNLPNNHLQYAITWFGLSLALAAVFLIWAFRRPR